MKEVVCSVALLAALAGCGGSETTPQTLVVVQQGVSTGGSSGGAAPPVGSVAPQRALDGTWETDSTAVNGRGAGHIQMTISTQNNALTWNTSTGFTYVCSLEGPRCVGTWSGRTGSGWFDVQFDSAGQRFAGTWGYGQDRSSTGAFEGARAL